MKKTLGLESEQGDLKRGWLKCRSLVAVSSARARGLSPTAVTGRSLQLPAQGVYRRPR